MCPDLVVIVHVRLQHVTEVALTEHNDVVKAFPSDRTDQPFGISVLPTDLIDLTLRMLSRVAGIQNEISHGSILNLNFDQAGVGRRLASSAGAGIWRPLR